MTIEDQIRTSSGELILDKILLAVLLKYRVELTREDFERVKANGATHVVWRVKDGAARFSAMSEEGAKAYLEEHRT